MRGYLEENPVRARLAAEAEENRWSSAWREGASQGAGCSRMTEWTRRSSSAIRPLPAGGRYVEKLDDRHTVRLPLVRKGSFFLN